MPDIVTFHIERYWIYHTTSTYSRSAHILCYAPNSSSPNAHLEFYREGVDIPDSAISPLGSIWLRFAAYQFHEIIETLRREKPVKAYFNPENKIGFIFTSHEPVGEEELEGPGS